ncbi:uncharacterized protein EDB93DRAFT_1095453, partial [Suillus bovinus]|uniref:uncharacterized protein n=1 Tax=Suillus bovinus TaxID=48563 RepID=UPI001B86D76E
SFHSIGKNKPEFMHFFLTTETFQSETFLVSDWLAHTPKKVVTKNFDFDCSVFDKLPKSILSTEKYICGVTPDTSSRGLLSDVPKSEHRFELRLTPLKTLGCTVRIADTSGFHVSTVIAAAHLIIKAHGL